MNNLNYGYNILRIGDKYISQIIYNNNATKNNIYYQYIKCQNSSDDKNELYAIFNNRDKIKLEYTTGEHFSTYNNLKEVYFLYNIHDDAIFNFQFSRYYYDIDYKNKNPDFNIYFKSRNEIIIEILPIYAYKDFGYYIIYIIQNMELNDTLTPLDNICYNKKLVDNNNNTNNNISIIKKVLSGYNYRNITINTAEKLEDNYTIYINVFANGYILDGFNNYLIYKAKSHKIKESDFPKKITPDGPNEGEEGMSTTTLNLIIIFSIIGGILLIIGLFFLYRYLNKKRKLNNISEIYKANSGEIMLKSETDNN